MANLSGIVKQSKKERVQIERQLWGLDAAIRPRSDRSRSKSTVGESQSTAEGCSNCEGSKARQTKDVSIGSSQDRSGATGKVGQG